MTTLVYGLAETGLAVARALVARGEAVLVADDTVTDERRAAASSLGLTLGEPPSATELERLVDRADTVVPSPGVPEGHDLIRLARRRGTPVLSELDLAWTWEQARLVGPRPMVAFTGTDGKTTTSLLAMAMVTASGRRALHAGNDGLPLVAAIDRDDVDVFVVECSSFRLAWAERFAPLGACWLNLGRDHLNWHRSMASYGDAKARVWEHQRPEDVAVGNAEDPVVASHLARAPARHVTFGAATADYRVDHGWLVGPSGGFASIDAMARRLPHDITNALAAAATVLETDLATATGVAEALTAFAHPPHRIQLVVEKDGVGWYDDSKATTPHAVVTALRGFDSVVLLAGGRNKNLDLGELADAADHVKAVVAIGEAADAVAAVFSGRCPVVVVGGRDARMAEAVEAAAGLAAAGDVVLLSPACASYDWYTSYARRGDDFAAEVRRLVGVA
jgi:UDP-N-acetylmuramoylalanine--D-glutamate ligase